MNTKRLFRLYGSYENLEAGQTYDALGKFI